MIDKDYDILGQKVTTVAIDRLSDFTGNSMKLREVIYVFDDSLIMHFWVNYRI